MKRPYIVRSKNIHAHWSIFVGDFVCIAIRINVLDIFGLFICYLLLADSLYVLI